MKGLWVALASSQLSTLKSHLNPKSQLPGEEVIKSEMWFGGLFNRSSNGTGVGVGMGIITRHFSRKRAENVRKINPRVTPQEASTIAQDLYHLINQRGPLTVSNAWIQAQVGFHDIYSPVFVRFNRFTCVILIYQCCISNRFSCLCCSYPQA